MKTFTVRTTNRLVIDALAAVARACDVSYVVDENGYITRRFNFNKASLAAELGIAGKEAAKFMDDLQEGINRKSYISLIKYVRLYTGMGLTEAKAVIDRYTIV